MEAKAILRTARISPQKARLVADQVRGLPAERAVNLLKFSDKKAAHLIKKVVESAIANAENNQGADVDELKVQTIMVDEGPTLKRFMARAKGRGTASSSAPATSLWLWAPPSKRIRKRPWVIKFIRLVSASAFPRTGTPSGTPTRPSSPVTWQPT